jgi:ribosomal protein S18 acetylase RimI-like enzyme
MFFELTDSLVDDIIFAMEDQNSQNFVDSNRAKVVDSSENDDFYPLPAWSSEDGFNLMESFVENCHSPLARSELKLCLESRRGVFRNFKDVLKSYPEVEKKWFLYKKKIMASKINEWYNDLRESWGLEKIEQSDFGEETEELVQDDFEFREYDSVRDGEFVRRGIEKLAEEYENQFEGEIGTALRELNFRASGFSADENKYGFVCYSQTEDFLGCILVALCPPNAKKTVVITDFFVNQDFRGLGIGKQLLSECFSSLKNRGIQWILAANSVIQKPMESLFTQFSFEKLGSGYIADLFKSEML